MKKAIALVLLTATFLGIISVGITAEEAILPFEDVKETDWFFDAVVYSYNNGIFKGTNNEGTLFSPSRKMTRAEFATTLFRLSGADPDDYSGDTGFSDVPSGKWMSAAVKWASEKGYVKGTGADKFDPNGTLDRQQLATMLFRFTSDNFSTDNSDEAVLDSFPDSEETALWAIDAMSWAASSKLIKGNEKGMLVPTMSATRAQVAQILTNFDALFAGSDADGIMNKELVLSINNTKYTEAKNIIFMIGDGMGFGIVEMTEYLYKDKLYNGTLAMNHIAQQSAQTTYSQNNDVTDSAAGGTALATGHKTENDYVAISPDGNVDYMSTLELAASKGKSTGVIATKSVTDATPAAFTAHTTSRDNHSDIAIQQMDKLIDGTLDILMGSGIKYYRSTDEVKAKLQEAKDAGVSYSESFDMTLNKELPILGLYDIDMEMDTTNEDNPTIAEMTSFALDKLSADENGFFLMVEGSQIDTYNHKTSLEYAAYECYEFDRAVAVVLEFIANNPDTVLIITADHETGGIIRPCYVNDETAASTYYTSGSHSYRKVPVYAVGCGVEALKGVKENVDLAIFVAGLLGEDDFGTRSEYKNLIENTNAENKASLVNENDFATATDDGIVVIFDGTNTEFTVPSSVYNTPVDEITNARVIHTEITNIGDNYLTVPVLDIDGWNIIPDTEFIKPGMTVTVSYILIPDLWENNAFAVDHFKFTQRDQIFSFDPTVAEMLIGDIYVCDRGLTD